MSRLLLRIASCSTVLAMAVLGLVVVPSAHAGGGPSCSFNVATHEVTIDLPGNGDSGTVTIGTGGNANLILFNGSPCSVASRFNTDLITVNGATDPGPGASNQAFTIDTSNGRFEPGNTTETAPGGISEIEFDVKLGEEAFDSDSLTLTGNSSIDNFTIGTAGINPNGDVDADISIGSSPNFTPENIT